MKNRERLFSAIKLKYGILGGVMLVLIILPLILSNYQLHLIIIVLLYIFLAQSWNIVGGFAGAFCFLHPVFMGIGAYTSTLLFTEMGINPWLGMLAGAILAVIAGIPITYISLRAKLPRLSFAIITLAIDFIALYVCESFNFLGGGDRGIQIPAHPGWVNFQFESKVGFYYTIFAMTFIIMVTCWQILRSRIGLCFRAIADNEQASEAIGVNVMKYTLIAMSFSSFFFALGGSFYAQFMGFVMPSTVISIKLVITVILGIAVGGIGTFWGPVVGVGSIMLIGEGILAQLPRFQSLNLLLYGIAVVVILYFMPHGIMAYLKDRR
ncbi:MAG: branched-chain amino acid ABC transporter permease, partial [Dehalococcoidales bacterium]|nr:branched-chain amino acid ABC transporter permease [Dehalococcoidales bacterium]